MNISVRFTLRTLLTWGFAFALASCQSPSAPTQNAQNNGVQDIRVQMVEPIRTTAKVEQFPLPNCGGTDRLAQSLGTYASANQSSSVSKRGTITGGGEVGIPETTQLKLEIQVELAYQNTFEAANSRLDSIEMAAAARTHVVYTIVWEEQVFESIVLYSLENQVYEVPYVYKLSVPKIDRSYNVSCDNSSGSDGSETIEDNNVVDSELPLVEVTHPQLFCAEENIPDGTSMTIRVPEGEVHAMTSGTICVASVCLPGGTDRGSVVIFLPSATYNVTGLNPTYNWHGCYYANPSQWEIIADQLASEQKIPGTCSDGDGCSIVDVVIIGPEGIVEQYQE